MRGLTEKQRCMLDFIKKFMDGNFMAPTVYELADSFKIKTSPVFAHLKALQRKKFLTRSSKARSISLTKPDMKSKRGSLPFPIPLMEERASVSPSECLSLQKNGEIICNPALLGCDLGHRNLFAFKMTGHSMKDAGILHGDILIVKQGRKAEAGRIVVVTVGWEIAVAGCHPLSDGSIELRPANPDFRTRTFSRDDVSIQGVAVAMQRKY